MAQFLFLARGTEKTPHSGVVPRGGTEAAVVWQAFKVGSLRAMYYLDERQDSSLKLDLPDRAAAEDFNQSLPMVAAGVVAADLIPIQLYDGLERQVGAVAGAATPGAR